MRIPNFNRGIKGTYVCLQLFFIIDGRLIDNIKVVAKSPYFFESRFEDFGYSRCWVSRTIIQVRGWYFILLSNGCLDGRLNGYHLVGYVFIYRNNGMRLSCIYPLPLRATI